MEGFGQLMAAWKSLLAREVDAMTYPICIGRVGLDVVEEIGSYLGRASWQNEPAVESALAKALGPRRARRSQLRKLLRQISPDKLQARSGTSIENPPDIENLRALLNAHTRVALALANGA